MKGVPARDSSRRSEAREDAPTTRRREPTEQAELDGARHQEDAHARRRAGPPRARPTRSREHLHVPLGEVELSTFANGEIYCRYGENIRGADVFVFQTHCDPINDRLMEQLIMIDAAKRASAKRITAVCPFYGYARQDRKAEGREPITARLVADMLTAAGADRVVTVDLHTGQIQGFFDFPVDHLTAVPVLAEYLARTLSSGDVTVVVARRRRRQARPSLRRPPRDARASRSSTSAGPKGTHNVAVATEVVGEIDGPHVRASSTT